MKRTKVDHTLNINLKGIDLTAYTAISMLQRRHALYDWLEKGNNASSRKIAKILNVSAATIITWRRNPLPEILREVNRRV